MSPLFKRKFIPLLFYFILIQSHDSKERNNNKDILLFNEPYSLLNINNNNMETYSNNKKPIKIFNSNEFIGDYKHHIRIICFGILFISFISILLIIFDCIENKKITRQYNLSANQKSNDEYRKLKNTYIASGKFLFSLFIMKYIYPLTNIIYMYNYDYPRYVRFVISVIRFLFIAILSIELGVFLENYYGNIAQKCLTFFVFLISHIVFDVIIRYLLDFDLIRRNIIKPKFENLRKYVYYNIKKDVLFNSKWHALRNRMITYFRICGNSILINKKIDKYGKYVNNKILNIKGKIPEKVNNSINQDDDKDFYENRLSERLLPPQNYKNIKRETVNSIQSNNTLNRNTISKMNDNNLYIVKGCEPFSFSRFGINNMKLKTVKKIEDIRNRYIVVKNTKFADSLDDDANVKTYENLEIEALENYTYISTDEIINKLNNRITNSNKVYLNIFINIILLILILLVSIGIYLSYSMIKAQTKEMGFIIILIIIFISDFIIYYFISIYIAFRIHKLYGYKKKNWFNKLIFKLFMEKYIVYLYRIRLLLIKYRKEFEFNDK
mgnify:CR=1 FL=1